MTYHHIKLSVPFGGARTAMLWHSLNSYTTMNGEIKIFESPEFGQIRTVMDKKGEPWFCLTDVCKVLGLTQRHVRERLEKGVVSTDPLSTRGGTQMANFVNEDGLYDVILDSRWLRENGYIFKKSTEPIQKWVEMGIFATELIAVVSILITTEYLSDALAYHLHITMVYELLSAKVWNELPEFPRQRIMHIT